MASKQKQGSNHGTQEKAQETVFLDILTKEEKEALLNKKMEEMDRKNAAMKRRHAEIEADRKAAEQRGQAVSLKAPPSPDAPTEGDRKEPDLRGSKTPPSRTRHSNGTGYESGNRSPQNRSDYGGNRHDRRPDNRNRPQHGNRPDHGQRQRQQQQHVERQEYARDAKSPEKSGGMKGVNNSEAKPSKFAAGRGKRLSQMSQQKLKAQEFEKKRPQNDSQNTPPPDPNYKFLADRSRDGAEDAPTPHSREPTSPSGRHPRNFGGPTLDNVKQKMKEDKEKQTQFRSGHSQSKMDMAMHMTGKERRNYSEWRSEREQIDRARIERQKNSQGTWKREWDLDKKEQSVRPPSPPSSRQMEPGRRPAGRIGSGRFISSELEDRPKGTRDDSVNIREKDRFQGRRVRPVSWGPDTAAREFQGDDGHTSASSRRYRMSSQSSDEGQRHVQKENDVIVIKIDNEFAASPTSPTGSGKRPGSSPSRGGFGTPSGRTSAPGSGRFPSSPSHRSPGSNRHMDPSQGEPGRGRGRGRGDRGRGRGREGHTERGRGRGRNVDQSDRGHEDSQEDRGRGRSDSRRGEGRPESREGRGRSRGRGRRGSNRQDRSGKPKTVTFQVQPIVHDVEMEWDHGADMHPVDDSIQGGYMDMQAPSSEVTEEEWEETEVNPEAWKMTVPSSTTYLEDSDSSGYVEDQKPQQNVPARKTQAKETTKTATEPQAPPAAGAAPHDNGFVDENGDPVDDDGDWEDDDDDDDDDSHHDSSAESLERFIQEHTLRLDVDSKTGDINLEGSSSASSQHTSNSGQGSQPTPTSPDYIKTPTGHVKVLDWGAEVDAYLGTATSPTAEGGPLVSPTQAEDTQPDPSDTSLNVSLNSNQSLDLPKKDPSPEKVSAKESVSNLTDLAKSCDKDKTSEQSDIQETSEQSDLISSEQIASEVQGEVPDGEQEEASTAHVVDEAPNRGQDVSCSDEAGSADKESTKETDSAVVTEAEPEIPRQTDTAAENVDSTESDTVEETDDNVTPAQPETTVETESFTTQEHEKDVPDNTESTGAQLHTDVGDDESDPSGDHTKPAEDTSTDVSETSSGTENTPQVTETQDSNAQSIAEQQLTPSCVTDTDDSPMENVSLQPIEEAKSEDSADKSIDTGLSDTQTTSEEGKEETIPQTDSSASKDEMEETVPSQPSESSKGDSEASDELEASSEKPAKAAGDDSTTAESTTPPGQSDETES